MFSAQMWTTANLTLHSDRFMAETIAMQSTAAGLLEVLRTGAERPGTMSVFRIHDLLSRRNMLELFFLLGE